MKSLLPTPDTPPRHSNIVAWLAAGTRLQPEGPAVVYGRRMLTHREFDALGNRIAHFLLHAGVTPGDRIGICLDRSVELVAAVAGILKAGAAYVPLDPAYPAERLSMMEQDAALRLVLAHAAHAGRFGQALIWEEIEKTVAGELPEPVGIEPDPEAAAYVIFTSGSTGRPKGIAMPHRALANLVEWQLERSTFTPVARVLQYSSISFDVSFQEIATTIASGGTLHLISNDDRKDPRRLLAQLVEQKIGRLFLPYVAMRSMIEAAHATGTYPSALKETITAGEQLRVDSAVRAFFARIPGATLDNQYGPSETHVITAQLLEGDPAAWPDLPGIGTPLKNCGTVILDENRQPVAEGAEGELFLAGRNLALGYIGRDDLTQAVFLPNPFAVPERPLLYKTGDLARYNSDGTIEFLGRRDHQIKIRGHRIEPGEINNAAAAFPGIGQCLTHAVSGADGTLKLAAYFTEAPGASVDSAALRAHLAQKLPDYMVPAFLVKLDRLPHTPSGKVDLKALPKPTLENSRFSGDALHYATPTEATLAEIWADLLELDAVPRSADFFELGGDSLRAVTLFLRIQQRLGMELPLATLAHAPTIQALAEVVDGTGRAPDLSAYRSLKVIQPGNAEKAPLFLVHGGQGNVLVFNALAKMLGPDQPVYAFQWPGWDGRRGPAHIGEMARVYRDELLRFRPAGPVRLGGYCIGALVAIELAQLLEAAGRAPEGPLVVWDSPNLESVHYRKDEPWDSARTIEAFNRMKAQLEAIRLPVAGHYDVPPSDYRAPSGRGALIRSIPGLLPLLRTGKALRQSARVLPERATVARHLVRGVPVPMELRPGHCLRTMVKAVKKHRSAQVRCDVLYFRSDCVVGRFFGLPGWWDDPFLGFAELCAGRFEAHAVGGGHTDVLEIPEMGAIVRQALGGKETL